jgi:hypothetical protein
LPKLVQCLDVGGDRSFREVGPYAAPRALRRSARKTWSAPDKGLLAIRNEESKRWQGFQIMPVQ